MTIRMQALQSFLGQATEGGADRVVKRGSEFDVASENRARELITKALARRTEGAKPAAPAKRRANKAAAAGPLPSAGGETGAGAAQSSSLPGLQPDQPAQRSRRRRGGAARAGQG